jgi:hypothetical protein
VSIWDDDDRSPDDPKWQSTHDTLVETARDFMKWIYRQLEAAWDDNNSDAVVDDNIRANEYLFTEEGKRCAALD